MKIPPLTAFSPSAAPITFFQRAIVSFKKSRHETCVRAACREDMKVCVRYRRTESGSPVSIVVQRRVSLGVYSVRRSASDLVVRHRDMRVRSEKEEELGVSGREKKLSQIFCRLATKERHVRGWGL